MENLFCVFILFFFCVGDVKMVFGIDIKKLYVCFFSFVCCLGDEIFVNNIKVVFDLIGFVYGNFDFFSNSKWFVFLRKFLYLDCFCVD